MLIWNHIDHSEARSLHVWILCASINDASVLFGIHSGHKETWHLDALTSLHCFWFCTIMAVSSWQRMPKCKHEWLLIMEDYIELTAPVQFQLWTVLDSNRLIGDLGIRLGLDHSIGLAYWPALLKI